MTESVEKDLRDFYAAYDAAYDPAPGVLRVRTRSHQQSSRIRLSWAALAAGATALAAAATSAVLLLVSGASVAYAGWTPTPTTPSASALAAAIAQCKKLAQPLSASLRATVGHSRADQCDGRPVLTEDAGNSIALIYAENGQMNELVTGGGLATNGFQGPIPPAPAPDRLTAPAMAVPNPDLQGSPAARLRREISHLNVLERQLHGYRGSVSLLVLEKYHFAGLARTSPGRL